VPRLNALTETFLFVNDHVARRVFPESPIHRSRQFGRHCCLFAGMISLASGPVSTHTLDHYPVAAGPER